MALEVFNRTEQKYILTEELYRSLEVRFAEYMQPDAFSRNGEFYTICNIYYDTPDHQIIRHSIDKPVYKEKLRLRSYGVVSQRDKVYLEIKKKFNGYVNKRRCSMHLEDACRYIETGKRPEGKHTSAEQVLREIDFMMDRYPGLAPALYLSYDRKAMSDLEAGDFRVTFDSNIRTRRYDLGLDRGNYGELLLPHGLWIMEAKTNHAVPCWFSEQLSEFKIYPTNFSKYGTEYCRALQRGELDPQPDCQNKKCV